MHLFSFLFRNFADHMQIGAITLTGQLTAFLPLLGIAAYFLPNIKE